jgi:3-oxoacyl-[acyl-carrier-protein] synthase II
MGFSYRNRVVVTGLGIIAPNGIGIDAFWESLIAGRSGIRRISRFDVTGWRSQIAGEVPDFDPNQWIPPEYKPKRRARHTQFAMAATKMALEDAGIQIADLELPYPLPVAVGVSTSSFEIIAESVTAVEKRGPRHASPAAYSEAPPNSVAGAIAEFLKVPVSARTFSSACVAGLDAIAEGAESIRRGEADLVLAGGTDAPISVVPLANFDVGGMASRFNETPEEASRPFDRRRDSGVISEGCAMLILENLESARARGVQPYLELLGNGVHTDLGGEPCSGYELTMKKALAEASLLPTDIDYISAWAPGHPEIDRIETEMIKRVFGAHAYRLAVSSIKGAIGNPLAAAGPLMMASCCLAFRHGLIPPTANYKEPDPACDLDCVPKARPSRLKHALLNGHGVGGSNTSMVVGQV